MHYIHTIIQLTHSWGRGRTCLGMCITVEVIGKTTLAEGIVPEGNTGAAMVGVGF